MKYRLVEHAYDGHMEYEEGPGSLSDLVQDKTSRVVKTGEANSLEAIKDLPAWLFEDHLEESPQDQLETQYSYELQAHVDGKWKYVKHVSPSEVEASWSEPVAFPSS